MRLKSLYGKFIQFRNLVPSLWHPFISGWLHRRQNGFVPCAVPNCRGLLNVPLEDFYECYALYCDTSLGNSEMAYFIDKLQAREVFYDIGGFRGTYSAFTKLKLKGNASIHIFEPIAKNVEAIRRIFALNQMEDCKIVPMAVGNGTSLAGRLTELGAILEFRLGDTQTPSVEKEFPCVSLDQHIGQGATPPTIIKIDVEGFELDVLRGARECLLKYRPRLWLEIHPKYLKAQGNSPAIVLNSLRETGYALSFFRDYDLPNSEDAYHLWCE